MFDQEEPNSYLERLADIFMAEGDSKTAEALLPKHNCGDDFVDQLKSFCK